MIEISLVIFFGYMVYNILQQSKWLYWPSTTLWPHTSQHTSSPLVVVMRLAHIFMGSAIKFKDSKADFQEHCNCPPPLVAHTPHTPTPFSSAPESPVFSVLLACWARAAWIIHVAVVAEAAGANSEAGQHLLSRPSGRHCNLELPQMHWAKIWFGTIWNFITVSETFKNILLWV